MLEYFMIIKLKHFIQWGFGTLSVNSSKSNSKSKTNATTGKTLSKLVKIQSLRKSVKH
jgi:hypothetical protein